MPTSNAPTGNVNVAVRHDSPSRTAPGPLSAVTNAPGNRCASSAGSNGTGYSASATRQERAVMPDKEYTLVDAIDSCMGSGCMSLSDALKAVGLDPAGSVARLREDVEIAQRARETIEQRGAEPAACDSCGGRETEDNEFVICHENGRTYRYCEDCYAP